MPERRRRLRADPDRERRIAAAEALATHPATPQAEREAAAAAVSRLRAAAKTHQRPPQAPREASYPEIEITKAPAPAQVRMPDELVGFRLQVDRTVDRLRRCCAKGCIAVISREDVVGPLSLVCSACARDLGWLPDRAAAELRRLYDLGRLNNPVLLDNVIRP